MFASWWTAVVLACAAPLPVKPAPAEDANKPRLIVKGEDYSIQALPPVFSLPIPKPNFPGRTKLISSGVVVLHTSIASGEKKNLASGSHTIRQSPPMGIDRFYHNITRIVGVAADEERLYVLRWTAATTEMIGVARPPLVSPENTGYTLLVFRPENGELLHSLDLKEADFPKEPLAETTLKGPLRVQGGSVACFGVTFEFKGTQLIKQQYEKKP